MLKLKLQYFGHWCEELALWERPWCWERLKAGGEGDDRGWGGWMASPTQWTWAWVSSGSWWWTGRPGVLQSMGLQRVGHDWATELNWPTIENHFAWRCQPPRRNPVQQSQKAPGNYWLILWTPLSIICSRKPTPCFGQVSLWPLWSLPECLDDHSC